VPRPTLRRLVGHQRTRRANRQLGLLLAAVAGAINAGGFLAIQRYTSHMTGIVSGVADDLALGHGGLALAGALLVGVFISGAVTTTLLINWARRRRLRSEFALSLLLEALLLLAFGLLGANLARTSALLVPATAVLLCFIMGLQNAMVTKISQAEVRTTHMTGVITDLGIELGKLLYWNRTPDTPAEPMVRANRDRLRLHAALLACFAGGGLAGALAFQSMGYFATVPIALLLAGLAAVPILDDLQAG
jgi:uncharacterized membrane protein YoaK (UPF0700 family)